MAGYCRACGAELLREAAYCHQCGHRREHADAVPDAGGAAAHAQSQGVRPDADVPGDVPRTPDAGRERDVSGDAEAAGGDARKEDAQQEQLLWEGGYSCRATYPVWIVAGLTTVLIIASSAPFVALRTGSFIALVTAVLCLGGAGLYLAYRRLSAHYELTDQRFIHQTGLLTRMTERVEVVDIDDVAYGQGPVERLLGVGTIKVISSDRSPGELLMRGIQDVSAVATQIDNARRAERRRRGLYIETD